MQNVTRLFAHGLINVLATATGIGSIIAIFWFLQPVMTFFVNRGVRGDFAFALGIIVPAGAVMLVGVALVETIRPLTRKPKARKRKS